MISFSKDIDIPFPNFTNVINDGQISKLSVVYLIVPKCYRSVQRLLPSFRALQSIHSIRAPTYLRYQSLSSADSYVKYTF